MDEWAMPYTSAPCADCRSYRDVQLDAVEQRYLCIYCREHCRLAREELDRDRRYEYLDDAATEKAMIKRGEIEP